MHLEFNAAKKSNSRSGVLRLNGHELRTPVLWLGQELTGVPKPWLLPSFRLPALMLNAFEILFEGNALKRLSEIGLKEYLKFDGPIFMDSGGYLLQRNMKYRIGAEKIVDVYSRLKPDLGAILDYPLRPTSSAARNRMRWLKTLQNTREMLASSLKVPLVPVLHGYTLSALRNSCDQIIQRFGRPRVVGVGSLVPLLRGMHIRNKFWKRLPEHAAECSRGLGDYPHLYYLVEAVRIVRQKFPRSLLHVFGVGSTTTMHILFYLGVDSIDSSSWRLKAAYGAIQLPGYADVFLRKRRDHVRSRRRIETKDWPVLLRCRCPVCGSYRGNREQQLLGQLRDSYRARATHNAWVLLREVDEFKKASARGNVEAFVRNRVKRSPRYSAMFEYALRSTELV